MQVATAVELVHGLIFFPGFKLSAEDHTKRFEGSIKLRIEYKAYDTAKENLDSEGHYMDTIDTYAEFPMMVEDIANGDVLYRRLMAILMRLYEHEAREALRLKGTGWAPFHPHRVNGMKRWLDTSNDESLIDLNQDFSFGVC